MASDMPEAIDKIQTPVGV